MLFNGYNRKSLGTKYLFFLLKFLLIVEWLVYPLDQDQVKLDTQNTQYLYGLLVTEEVGFVERLMKYCSQATKQKSVA